MFAGLSNDAPETVINENAFGSKDIQNDKFLHKLNSESVKISKPSSLFSNPLSASLKVRLANIVKCGTLGNDNSSDSGYEEVQDGNKLMLAQMPPPDVLQTLWVQQQNTFRQKHVLHAKSCVRISGQWCDYR